jgi:hypothetical protein
MDIGGIAKLATSMAETGTNADVQTAVMGKIQDVVKTTGAQMVDALNAVPKVNLPDHLGNNVNTTA